MSLYLKKYVGTYSVKAEYDKSTNDYPRTHDGELDKSFSDLYIPCKGGSRIIHLQKNILMACYMSIGVGHNRLKELYTNEIGSIDKFQTVDENNKVIKFDFGSMYKELIDSKILTEISEMDEIIFYFKDENMDKVANVLVPSRNSVKRQPFSRKNLPKGKYVIPSENLDEYKAISSILSKGGLSVVKKLNNEFMLTLVKKSLSLESIKQDVRSKNIKLKEYFHSIGVWDKYIKFLNERSL